MKTQAKIWAAAGLAVFALSSPAQPTNFIINEFDTADEATGWIRWWGAAQQLYEHDATVDADNDAGSGSLKATIAFNLASYGGDNQFSLVRRFPQIDGSVYTNLAFDIRWDPSSPVRPSGDHGWFEF